MRSILRVVDAINEWGGKIISFLIIALIGIVIWGVVMRYIFRSPVSLALFSSQRLLLIYILMGGAYALRTRAHVNMDILYNRFSPRRRAIVDLATSALFFLFCAAMIWGAYIWKYPIWQYVKLPPAVNPLRGIMVYPTYLWTVVATFLMLLQGLAKFIRDLATAITGREAI